MRKKEIVHMYNRASGTLHSIRTDLIKHIEANGGKWVDHGTDDNDRVCFEWRGQLLGVSTHSWDVDCKRVSFSEFLATITQ